MEKKTRTLGKLKLNQLSKEEKLRVSEMRTLKGGCMSDCACACWSGTSGETTNVSSPNTSY